MFTAILLTQLVLYFIFQVIYYEFVDDHLSNPNILRYSCITFLILDATFIAILGWLFTNTILKLVIKIQTNKVKDAMSDTLQPIRKLRSLHNVSVTPIMDDFYTIKDNKTNKTNNNNNNNIITPALPEGDEGSSTENSSGDDRDINLRLTLHDHSTSPRGQPALSPVPLSSRDNLNAQVQ